MVEHRDGRSTSSRDTLSAIAIGLFQKYHKTLSLSIKSLHKQCFYFLLQPREVPGENGNNVYAKFWRTSKDYYGIIESGQCKFIDEYFSLFAA